MDKFEFGDPVDICLALGDISGYYLCDDSLYTLPGYSHTAFTVIKRNPNFKLPLVETDWEYAKRHYPALSEVFDKAKQTYSLDDYHFVIIPLFHLAKIPQYEVEELINQLEYQLKHDSL